MRRWPTLLVCLLVSGCVTAAPDVLRHVILPEQRALDVRDPAEFPAAPLPPTAPPRTVSTPELKAGEWPLSLDEAIRIALENAKVIRILTGLSASSSGRTIYDPAITNATVDVEQARFDPTLTHRSTWNHTDTPGAALDPLDPGRAVLTGRQADEYRSEIGLAKTNVLGGQLELNRTDSVTRFDGPGFPLNPEGRSTTELRYTQPLLQGGGFRVNMAPVVIARLNTEQSFFQYKDGVQELVRGVIEGYWNLVQARIDVWARRIQDQQSEEAHSRERARLKTGLADLKDVSQARVTYNQFRASLIAAEANLLAREAALRNLLGLPPGDQRQIIPTSAPTSERFRPNWEELVRVAEQRRPDIVELKIILEADQQRLILAEDQARPRLDAVALYRWNGLSGEMPNGDRLASGGGQFTDWTLGINFSVPLGLRQGRARVRQQELILARDRANLEQGLHAAIHELAASVRELDSSFEQYLAFRETRAAAFENLQVQIEQFKARRNIYLNVLVALNDWGAAVTSEARALLNYNIALATLERQTGTILETHGLVFVEERTRAAGPLGCLGHDRYYPSAVVPAGQPARYPGQAEPAENAFDLRNPTVPEVPPKP
jgi:outer membrane protein TolC